MRLCYDVDLINFEAWSGAKSTLNRIIKEDLCDEAEALIMEALNGYEEPVDETAVNDILWFEEDWLFENLGIRTESIIKEELDDAKSELENLLSDYAEEVEDMSEEEAEAWYNDNYDSEISELREKIEELEEEYASC